MVRMVRERVPAFARDFPRDPALDALVEAFADGDYARVRAEAPKLARESEDPAVQKAARELRARVEADPLAVKLLLVTGALLVALAAWWITHGLPPAPLGPPSAKPPTTVERVR